MNKKIIFAIVVLLVSLLLFKKEDGFGVDKVPFRKLKFSSISNKEAAFSITEVEKGEYAFLVFHDEDNNGECRTNWIGIPKEGVGKSGEYDNRPSFNNSKFYFNGTQIKFSVIIKYL